MLANFYMTAVCTEVELLLLLFLLLSLIMNVWEDWGTDAAGCWLLACLLTFYALLPYLRGSDLHALMYARRAAKWTASGVCSGWGGDVKAFGVLFGMGRCPNNHTAARRRPHPHPHPR